MLETLTGAVVNDLLKRDDLPSEVQRALELRANGGKTSVAKYDKLINVADKGSLKNMFTYHGAATGRWASRGGINMQNLPRPSIKDTETGLKAMLTGDLDFVHMLYDDPVAVASSVIRSVIKAPEGYHFVDADYSSIENRVAPWLAGDQGHLDEFRNGLDEYKTFASDMYGVAYEAVSGDQRQVAKSAVLGCVYGQGAKGLVNYAASMGTELTEEQAKEMVNLYRNKRKAIANMWRLCDDAARQAVIAAEKGRLITTQAGTLLFRIDGDFLKMQLPSGRDISFYKPRVELLETPWGELRNTVTCEGVNTFTRFWSRNKLIGSSIFQSAVQGVARDLLANAMLRLDNSGFTLIGCFHDELLAQVPDSDTNALDRMIDLMTTNPNWAKGLPLKAEGWTGKRFRK